MKCKYCGIETVENAKFCHECSGVIREEDYEGILGITITPDDIAEYIITGKIQKTIEIGKHIKTTISTLTTGEHKEMNKLIDTATSSISSKATYDLEVNHHMLAYAVKALNTNIWPVGLEKTLKCAEGLGSEVAAILVNRINYLHLAIGSKIQLKDF